MATPTKKANAKQQKDYLEAFQPYVTNLQQGSEGQCYGSCPFHHDEDPSFSFNRNTGLWKCHADSCGEEGNVQHFLRLLGEEGFDETNGGLSREGTPADRETEEIYEYLDEQGKPQHRVLRFKPKGFAQQQPDGQGGWKLGLKGVERVPYCLDRLAQKKPKTLYIAEGEKDVDRLWSVGFPATCNPMGAKKWKQDYTNRLLTFLKPEEVVIFADADDDGRAHAAQVAETWQGKVKAIRVIEKYPSGAKDVSDYLDAGYTKRDLKALIKEAKPLTAQELEPRSAVEVTDQDEQLPAEAPQDDLPRFPEAAYVGVAGDFAATYAEHLESPRQFFYLDYLTVLGSILSPHVRLDSQLREEPRIYGVKVGESWIARKSSSQDEVIRFFEPLREHEDRVTICNGAGSAEGLAKRMQSNPGIPMILVYDEFRALVDKAGVQGSVLLPMVTSLFSTTVYENVTKQSEIIVRDAHLSLLGACTIDTFKTMFKPHFRAIGALNRLFIVTGRRETIRPVPKAIPEKTLNTLRKRTEGHIERAEQEEPAIAFTAKGQRRWEEWYKALPASPYSARLDTYGLRLLMLGAVTTEARKIDRPLVDAVIALLDYEYKVRRELDPVDADNSIARMEQCILRQLSKGRMPDSRLQNLCHVRRTGVWAYEQAMKNLRGQECIGSTPAGRGKHVWLTEAGKEAGQDA